MHPTPRSAFPRALVTPTWTPSTAPEDAKKKRLATKRCRLPTLILLLQKKSSHHVCPKRPTPQVGSVQRQKKRMGQCVHHDASPQMASMQLPRSSHLGINYRPFWPAQQATHKQHPTQAILATLGRFAMTYGSFCIAARLEQLPNNACELNSLASTTGKPLDTSCITTAFC